MSTTENDPFKHLRVRQIAAVECIEALRPLNSDDQVRALRTVIAFYELEVDLGLKE